MVCGGNRIRTYEVIRQQIYSLSQLAALVFPQNLISVLLRTFEMAFSGSFSKKRVQN